MADWGHSVPRRITVLIAAGSMTFASLSVLQVLIAGTDRFEAPRLSRGRLVVRLPEIAFLGTDREGVVSRFEDYHLM
jgi:hypothetical protein